MVTRANLSVDSLNDNLQDFGRSRPEIQALFVFGSVATGKPHPGSDVDVAVLVDPDRDSDKALRLALQYSVELEDRLQISVDVVILNSAAPMLRFQVISKGKMVYSTDPQRTRRFLGDALVEFYDEIVMIERLQNLAIRRLIGR